MSLWKSVKEFFALDPVDDYDPEDDYVKNARGYDADREREAHRDYDDNEGRRDNIRNLDPIAPRPAAGLYTAPVDYQPTIVTVTLRSYSKASEVGAPFRDGDIVIFTIADMGVDEARRVIDFSAGLAFAARGSMEKLQSRVFALVPEGVRITTDELQRAAQLG